MRNSGPFPTCSHAPQGAIILSGGLTHWNKKRFNYYIKLSKMKQIKNLKKSIKILNISVNATQQLWKAKALGTKYFQYNVSDTNESLSYNRTMSNTTKWQNISSGITGFAVALLNYSAKTDSAALNIRIEVPPSEPAGFKQSNLTFIAELTSLTKR